jgi:hypothetical protein
MLLRTSEVHTLLLPEIGNGTLANTQTPNVGSTLAPLKQFGKLGSQRKQIKMV